MWRGQRQGERDAKETLRSPGRWEHWGRREEAGAGGEGGREGGKGGRGRAGGRQGGAGGGRQGRAGEGGAQEGQKLQQEEAGERQTGRGGERNTASKPLLGLTGTPHSHCAKHIQTRELFISFTSTTTEEYTSRGQREKEVIKEEDKQMINTFQSCVLLSSSLRVTSEHTRTVAPRLLCP